MVSSIAYSPTSKLLVSGSYDKTVRIWQLGSGVEKHWFLGHKSAVTSVAFGPDSRAVLSGGMDKNIFYRDNDARKELQYFYSSAVVECVAISADGRYMLSGTVGQGSTMWEVGSGRELRKLNVGGFTSCVAFSSRDSLIAVSSSDGDVSVFDRVDGSVKATFKVMRNGVGQMVNSLRFSRDGSNILTSSPNQLQMWQSHTGRENGRLEMGTAPISCADISSDGSMAVTGHTDSLVRLWNLSTGKELRQYKGHVDGIKTVACAPDGQSLASGGFDKTIRVWRIA